MALRTDGTVAAVGGWNKGECDVEDWTDIVAVAAGGNHTVGVRSDGTAVATGNHDYGRCDVEDWTDLVAVSAGRYHTVGLFHGHHLRKSGHIQDLVNIGIDAGDLKMRQVFL